MPDALDVCWTSRAHLVPMILVLMAVLTSGGRARVEDQARSDPSVTPQRLKHGLGPRRSLSTRFWCGRTARSNGRPHQDLPRHLPETCPSTLDGCPRPSHSGPWDASLQPWLFCSPLSLRSSSTPSSSLPRRSGYSPFRSPFATSGRAFPSDRCASASNLTCHPTPIRTTALPADRGCDGGKRGATWRLAYSDDRVLGRVEDCAGVRTYALAASAKRTSRPVEASSGRGFPPMQRR